eukprot:gene14577-biopygen10469
MFNSEGPRRAPQSPSEGSSEGPQCLTRRVLGGLHRAPSEGSSEGPQCLTRRVLGGLLRAPRRAPRRVLQLQLGGSSEGSSEPLGGVLGALHSAEGLRRVLREEGPAEGPQRGGLEAEEGCSQDPHPRGALHTLHEELLGDSSERRVGGVQEGWRGPRSWSLLGGS